MDDTYYDRHAHGTKNNFCILKCKKYTTCKKWLMKRRFCRFCLKIVFADNKCIQWVLKRL